MPGTQFPLRERGDQGQAHVMAQSYNLAPGHDPEDSRMVRVTSPQHRPSKAMGPVRGWWLLLSAALGMLLLMLLVAMCWPHTVEPVESEAVIDLHEINTSHGPVPLKLRVSGVDCGLSGYHRLLNGNYTYQGKAPDGRAFYKSEEAHPAPSAPGSQTPWFFTPINQLKGWFQPAEWHHTYLYYTGHSTSALYGEWYFLYSNHSDGRTGTTIARLFVTRPSGPPVPEVTVAPGPPHALPPRRATWNVLCDSTALNTSMWIAKEVDFRAQGKGIETNLTGHWEYVNMVMRGSASILSQGQEKFNMRGGSVRTKAGIGLGGSVGNSNELQGTLGLHYTKQLTKSWETTMSNSQERSVETRFSRSGALFVWTWDIKETSLGTYLGSYKSAEYAITESIVQKPKCCPAYASDFPAYQNCLAGGELPNCALQSAHHLFG